MQEPLNLGEGWSKHDPAKHIPKSNPIFAELIYGYNVVNPDAPRRCRNCVIPVSLTIKSENLIVTPDERGYWHSHPAFLYRQAFFPLVIIVIWCTAATILYLRRYFPYGNFPEIQGDVIPNLVLGLSLFVFLPLAIANAYSLKAESTRKWRFEYPWLSCNPMWFADQDCEVLAIRPQGRHNEPAMFLMPPKSQRLRDWPLLTMMPLSKDKNIWRFKRTGDNFRPHSSGFWAGWWTTLILLTAALIVGPELSMSLENELSRNIGYGLTGFAVILTIANLYPGCTEIRLRWTDQNTAKEAAKWITHLPVK